MQLTHHNAGGHYEIRSVDSGNIRIGDQSFTQSLIVTPDRLIPEWPVHTIRDLTPDQLNAILELEPDVVLLGTGDELHFPEQWVFMEFYQRGIGLEAMDTLAACRTYNVLVSEERKVAAGLML